jgi:excisionase family DNA binding protein
VVVEISLSEEDIDRLAQRVVALLSTTAINKPSPSWLDVAGAAAHLKLSENAIRGLVKRQQIPFHRTENNRLRFSVTELDRWVRTGTCAESSEDLR